MEQLGEGPDGPQKQYFPQIVLSPSISHSDIIILWAFKQPQFGLKLEVWFLCAPCTRGCCILLVLRCIVLCLLLLYAAVFRLAQCEYSWYAAVSQTELAASEPQWSGCSQPGYPGSKWLPLLRPADQFYINKICGSVWHDGSDHFWKVIAQLAVSNPMNRAGRKGIFSQRSRCSKMAVILIWFEFRSENGQLLYIHIGLFGGQTFYYWRWLLFHLWLVLMLSYETH